MDYVELAKNVLLSEGAFGIYATILGIILAYVFNNYINKPVARRIAYDVAVAVETQTEEGTALDTFLDEFIKRFNEEAGRDPNAGELKTALDIKNKRISIDFQRPF